MEQAVIPGNFKRRYKRSPYDCVCCSTKSLFSSIGDVLSRSRLPSPLILAHFPNRNYQSRSIKYNCKVIELEDLENLWPAKKCFGRGDGLSLSGSVTYLFILLAKRFSCSLLCCCVYLFVCVVWIVYTLVSFCIFFFFLT